MSTVADTSFDAFDHAYDQPKSPRSGELPDSQRFKKRLNVDDRPSSAWFEFDPHRADDEVVRRWKSNFNNMLAKERKELIEAERAAAVAQEKVNRLEADLEHEQRHRFLERAAADRERRLTHERDRLVEVMRPVAVHNPIAAVVPTHDNHRPAPGRASDDS
jgi:hypothetical protein